MKIVTRTEAQAAGLSRYFTGVPCCRGHVAERQLPSGNCLACHNARMHNMSSEQKQKHREACARSHQKHGDKTRARNRKNYSGFTPELVEQRLQEQGGRCAICKVTLQGRFNIHADHCHKTLVQRGLLCRACNVGLGMFKEDPDLFQTAIEYLNTWKKVTTP